MLVLNIKNILRNKLTLVLFGLISILVILTIIVYTLAMKSNILRGTKIGDIIGRIGSDNNIINMTSYSAEFEITVKSNKNTNTYTMKEWYKKGIGTKQEYLDSSNNKVTILTLNNKTIIQNENQKNVMVLNEYITKYTNLLSINTFIDIYQKYKEKDCCFDANSYEKVNNIYMILDNSCKMGENCNCDVSEIVKNVSKIELKVDKNTGKPITYIVYDNDKKECISIVYNKFDINAEIKEKEFKE